MEIETLPIDIDLFLNEYNNLSFDIMIKFISKNFCNYRNRKKKIYLRKSKYQNGRCCHHSIEEYEKQKRIYKNGTNDTQITKQKCENILEQQIFNVEKTNNYSLIVNNNNCNLEKKNSFTSNNIKEVGIKKKNDKEISSDVISPIVNNSSEIYKKDKVLNINNNNNILFNDISDISNLKILDNDNQDLYKKESNNCNIDKILLIESIKILEKENSKLKYDISIQKKLWKRQKIKEC